MTSTGTSALLRRLGSGAPARLRLVCLPYAGGAAGIFRGWASELPEDVEVVALQLPGRQDRLREPRLTQLEGIADRLVAEMRVLPSLPTALFGHSFGGVLAFELARRLCASSRAPFAVVVGGCRAPQLPRVTPAIHDLSDAALCAALIERYGLSRTVLQDPELRPVVLPSLRSDLQALETYSYRCDWRIEAPITVLRGLRDASVSLSDARAWREVAPLGNIHEVDADHFFVDSHRSWVLARVSEVLATGRLLGCRPSRPQSAGGV